jgi:hypothetical protein
VDVSDCVGSSANEQAVDIDRVHAPLLPVASISPTLAIDSYVAHLNKQTTENDAKESLRCRVAYPFYAMQQGIDPSGDVSIEQPSTVSTGLDERVR